MYNPREAKADFHIYLFAFYLFAMLIAFIFLGLTFNNAKRYTYLNWTGITITGEVIAAERGPSTWKEKTVTNADLFPDKSRYTFRYKAKTGDAYSGDIIMPSLKAIGKFRTIRNGRIYFDNQAKHIYNIGDKLEIIYAEKQPEIFLPIEFYKRLKSDLDMALWSLGTILVALCLFTLQIVRYRRFRAESRFY